MPKEHSLQRRMIRPLTQILSRCFWRWWRWIWLTAETTWCRFCNTFLYSRLGILNRFNSRNSFHRFTHVWKIKFAFWDFIFSANFLVRRVLVFYDTIGWSRSAHNSEFITSECEWTFHADPLWSSITDDSQVKILLLLARYKPTVHFHFLVWFTRST